MSERSDDGVPWERLRTLTAARIGLARRGAGLATPAVLEFRLAHARARDAVHDALDVEQLARDVEALGLGLPALQAASRAADRRTYLLRPDLGRRLDDDSAARLATHRGACDLVTVLADGLSATAVQAYAAPTLGAMLAPLAAAGWRLGPVVIASQGRVALGDAIAAALGAGAVAILVGERPGLSAPHSLGAYATWRPGPASSDADRNCVSNIRPEGIPPATAGARLAWLLAAMRSRGLSGVALKDESDRPALDDALGEAANIPR